MICKSLIGVARDCGDNNLGSIKTALVGSKSDILSKVVTENTNPDSDGTVTAITRVVGSKFEKIELVKDTSMMSQELNVDLVGDTHSYTQVVELGFRRIDLRKRNAVEALVHGRRDLVIIVEDNNDEWWLIGADQGARVSANPLTTNNTRAAGQSMPLTLTSENERHQLLKVDAQIVNGLLTAAV